MHGGICNSGAAKEPARVRWSPGQMIIQGAGGTAKEPARVPTRYGRGPPQTGCNVLSSTERSCHRLQRPLAERKFRHRLQRSFTECKVLLRFPAANGRFSRENLALDGEALHSAAEHRTRRRGAAAAAGQDQGHRCARAPAKREALQPTRPWANRAGRATNASLGQQAPRAGRATNAA